MTFTIPVKPVTKKNSQRIVQAKGRAFIVPSLAYKAYETQAMKWIPRLEKPIDYPVEIECRFFMPTKHRVDLTNLLEAIDDVLVGANFIKDDCSTILVSHDGSRVFYDKDNPRTEVSVREVQIEE